MGLACAHYLLESGRGATVIDQGSAGCGASHGNCGTLTPSHAPPLAMPGMIANALACLFKADAPFRIAPRFDPALARWLLDFARRCNWPDFHRATLARIPLLLRSRALIERLVQDEGLACEFEPTGTLYVFRDTRAFAESSWLPRILGEIGLPVDTLDGAQALALEPALREGVAGAYFNPLDAHLRPDRYAEELARIVRRRGGTIEEGARIESIERSGRRIARVRTTRGEFIGREVVLALGSWSPRFARQIGLRLPIQPGKGYSITYTRPVLCPRIPLVLKEPSVCVTSWRSGYRLGSTMEFAGYDTRLNRTRLDALRRGAAAYLTEPEGGEMVEEWYGWRPMTPDDLPMLGRAPGIDNLILATGHGMLGVSMSAMTGLLVSEIANGREPSLDIAPYDAARFDRGSAGISG
ncbi:MAG TPA: FAD-dependent oxidoreductase [Rhodanobacteraceae bacterium]|nr:FAD-dependent oxidoreductase [Rhodanobacteraceae bacterium]